MHTRYVDKYLSKNILIGYDGSKNLFPSNS